VVYQRFDEGFSLQNLVTEISLGSETHVAARGRYTTFPTLPLNKSATPMMLGHLVIFLEAGICTHLERVKWGQKNHAVLLTLHAAPPSG
jgi:hypothetical protein